MACLSKIVVACMALGAGASAQFGPVVADANKCKWDSDMRGDLKNGESRSCVPELNYGEYDENTCHCGTARTGRKCVAVYDASKYNGTSKYRCELPECKAGDYSTPKKCLADGDKEEDDDTNRCACPENHQCSESTKTCLPKCEGEGKCDEECYCSEGTTCENITDSYNQTSTAKKCMLPKCKDDICDESCSCEADSACHAASNSSGSDTCKPVCSISSNDTRLTGNETCSGDNATCTCGPGKRCIEIEASHAPAQYGSNETKYECQDVPVADNSTDVVNATVITETAVECSSVSGSNTTVEEFTKACSKLTAGCEAVIASGKNCSATDACKCNKKSYAQKAEDAQVSSAQKCFSWFAVLVMILQL